MSGIYVPDVSQPGEGDFELWIAIRKDGSFTYNVRGGWQDGTQKAVPVPKHGRLIDADVLTAKFKEMGLGEHSLIERLFADGVYEMIDYIPTVIPAEQPKEAT